MSRHTMVVDLLEQLDSADEHDIDLLVDLLVAEDERRARPALPAHGAHVGGADRGQLDLDEGLSG